ncbi:hypothetical protein BGZ60DRAFT_148863 [Tricladium varicosporioides]|nr:hypothetical protein BGZ60DRAFT_148863 [Hymenoscyphus varicosporioides]
MNGIVWSFDQSTTVLILSFIDQSTAMTSSYDQIQPWGTEASSVTSTSMCCSSCLELTCLCGYYPSNDTSHQYSFEEAGNWKYSPLIHQSGQQQLLDSSPRGSSYAISREHTRLTNAPPHLPMNIAKQYYASRNTNRMLFASGITFGTYNDFPYGSQLPEAVDRTSLTPEPPNTSQPDTFQTLYEFGDQMITLSPEGRSFPSSSILRGEEYDNFELSSIPSCSNDSVQVMGVRGLNIGPLPQGSSLETSDFVISQPAGSPLGISTLSSHLSPPDSSSSYPYINQRTRSTRNKLTASPSSTHEPAFCHYPMCDMAYFQNTRELKLHLNHHIAELIRDWEPGIPSSCYWPTCTSNLVFNSRKLYQTHLENIHIKPLLCTVQGCKHKSPFRNNYDLDRHIRTIHNSEKEWNCPYLDCSIGPFSRKDKWLIHLRQHRASDFTCPLPHCSTETVRSFQSQKQVVKHIQESHGRYECALGSCVNGQRSRFSGSGLLQHLELEHSLSEEGCSEAFNWMKSLKETTISLQHFSVSADWQNCSICPLIIS